MLHVDNGCAAPLCLSDDTGKLYHTTCDRYDEESTA